MYYKNQEALHYEAIKRHVIDEEASHGIISPFLFLFYLSFPTSSFISVNHDHYLCTLDLRNFTP